MIDKKVFQPNTLHVKYERNTPYFQIVSNNDVLTNLQTDYKLELYASWEQERSLSIRIILKTFHSVIHFYTLIPYWKKYDQKVIRFLTSFVQQDKVKVAFTSSNKNEEIVKFLSISPSVKEMCKLYLGEILVFKPNDGMEETFKHMPIGFLAPFATTSFFLFLCKTDDYLYEKMKFAPNEDIQFHVTTTDMYITLSLTFQGIVFSSLTIGKEDISEPIIEDFHLLLKHQKIFLAICNQSMKNKQYLNFSKEIEEEKLKSIYMFFNQSYKESL
jgi:hypothetical protein